MASVSVSLDNITLMSEQLEGELNEFLDADLTNIPFDDYTQQVTIFVGIFCKALPCLL